MNKVERTIPNPVSDLLKHAVIGGVGIGAAPAQKVPPGMGVVILYVPLEQVTKRSAPELQNDLGLPWAVDGGGTAWFDELI